MRVRSVASLPLWVLTYHMYSFFMNSFPKWSPFTAFAITTDLLNYVKIHDHLLSYDLGNNGIFVGGHLTQLGDRSDIVANKELTLAIIANAGAALTTINAGEAFMGSGAFDSTSTNFGNMWAGFANFLDQVNFACARMTLEEYGCTFAALDVQIISHCNVAQSFIRVDS